MKRPMMELKTKMSKIGDVESYLHVPIISNGKAVGVVYKVEELEDEYELSIGIWSKFTQREFIDDKLMSISIG